MAGAEARRPVRSPSLADALIAVAILITLIAARFLVHGAAAILGQTQVALILAATLAAGVAWNAGQVGPDPTEAVTEGIGSALPAILMLLAVGALICGACFGKPSSPLSDTANFGSLTSNVDQTPAGKVRSAPTQPSPKSIRDSFSREQQAIH